MQVAILTALSGAVVLMICCWPMFVGRLFLYADIANQHLPQRMFYAQSLSEGSSPFWLPNLFCGFYLHAEGQVGMFHPLHWLIYRVLPMSFAFRLESVIPYPVAFFGMFYFLRKLNLAPHAAACGGIVFALSPFTLARLTHPNWVQIIAHIPWLLLLIEILATTSNARVLRGARAGFALLIGSQLLAGHPGAVIQSSLYVGTYSIYRSYVSRSWNLFAWIAASCAVGILLGAVQWVPTLEMIWESHRASPTDDYLLAGSLDPWNLLQILSPYLYRGQAFLIDPPDAIGQLFYFGAAFPVALLWLWLRRSEIFAGSRATVSLLVGVCVLALLLALGKTAGVYELFAHLPLFGDLRSPSRQTLLIYLVAAGVIAVGFADVSRAVINAPERRFDRAYWIWLVPAVACLLGVAAFATPPQSAFGANLAEPQMILLGALLSIVCTALWFAAARGSSAAVAGLVIFIAVDQAAYGSALWWTETPKTLDQHLRSIWHPPKTPPGRVAYGFTDSVWVGEDGHVRYKASTRYMVHDTHLVWGYSGLYPERRLAPFDPKNIEVAGAAYSRTGKRMLALPDPLPKFRFVVDVRVTNDLAKDIQTTDVRTTALVDAPIEVELGAVGSVEVREERPGEMHLIVDVPTRQLLVIAESHHAGWKLAIDGEEAPVFRVYGDYMGAVIDRGRHEVALDFRPRSLDLGGLGSILGLTLVVVLVFYSPTPSGNTPPARSSAV